MAGPSVTKPVNQSAQHLLDQARSLLLGGRFAEAEARYRQYQRKFPPHVEASFNLGLALHRQGKLEEAMRAYRQALKLSPELLEAHQNLGHAHHTLTQLDEAAAYYQRVLALKPDHAEVHNNLGNVRKDQGHPDLAIKHYEQTLAVNPQHALAYNNLGNAFRELGMLDEALSCYQKALEINPAQIDSLGNLLFVLSYHPFCPPEQYRAIAEEFGSQASALAQPWQQWRTLPAAPLRIGLVSGDMRRHPVGYFLENIFKHLDPQKTALFAYATKPQEDDLTARIKPLFTAWRSLSGLSDQAAAQCIHDDGIHILLDLAGHTAHNRLPVFAWKPAPLQISWLGYFASTGLAQMDAVLADPVSVPQTLQVQFSERVLYLPDTRLCFSPPQEVVAVTAPPAQRIGFLTFGSFQNLTKLNAQVLAAWSRILGRLPQARLRLQNQQFQSAAVQAFFLEKLAEQQIPADRVTLTGPVSRQDYLAAHAEIDLILDTFPYPGGTTTCEALWMGVHTLTLAGSSMLARQGASMLAAVGLDDWIAGDGEEYVNKAVAFASDLSALTMLRKSLRAQALSSPLFDGERFARNLENTLVQAWQTHRP